MLQVNSRFKEICQIFVKKIVHDLGSKQLSKPDIFAFSPFVIPVPKSLKNKESAVFLYNISGINFHLTWNEAIFKIKQGKEFEREKYEGCWDTLKRDFKNRDYFNDVMCKFQSSYTNTSTKSDIPRVPLSCLIDYCGFRVLCESDIYIDDAREYCFKTYNTIEKTENLKNLLETLTRTKQSEAKDNDDKKVPETYINLNYVEKKETDWSVKINYYSISRYFYKLFTQEIENTFFDEKLSKIINTPDKDSLNIKTSISDESEVLNLGNEHILLGKDSKRDLRQLEYFDYEGKMPKIEKESWLDPKMFNYIMNPSMLIEIKNEQKGNSKLLNNFLDSKEKESKRIFYRPEFIFKYDTENFPINGDKEISNETEFNKNIKKFAHMNVNNPLDKEFRDKYIHCFINCLDTFFYKPYDSESLTDIFHFYGINLSYLGLVCELTKVPHVRELCVIEMIARICKKLIFNIMSAKILDNALEDFYSGSNEMRISGTNSNEYEVSDYLQNVPVTFMVKYHSEYLHKIHLLADFDNAHKYYNKEKDKSGTGVRGLYRKMWYKCENYKNITQGLKEMINSNLQKYDNSKKTTSKTSNDKNMNNTINTEKQILKENNSEIVKFLNTLFNVDIDKKYEIDILGERYNRFSLWGFIFTKIKQDYKVNDYFMKFFDPQYLSLPALLTSIQYHTGLVIKLEIKDNTKFSNKDLINHEFSEDSILEIKPIVTSYSYRNFHVNKYVENVMRIKYETFYEPLLQKSLIFKSFINKVMKVNNIFIHCYAIYMTLIGKKENQLTENEEEHILKHILDLKDKSAIKSNYLSDYLKNQFTTNSLRFESLSFYIVNIIDNLMQDEINTHNPSHINNNKSYNSSIDFSTLTDYITEYWFTNHPFICLLNIIFARLHLRLCLLKINNSEETVKKFENYYKQALNIAIISLGNNNIFVAQLCEEIGKTYISTDIVNYPKYYEGTNHLLAAHEIYKYHKDGFLDYYTSNLKNLSKYFVKLGNYRYALEYGYELINTYMKIIGNTQQSSDKGRDIVKRKIRNCLINLIYICKSLEEAEKGIEFCRILIFEIEKSNALEVFHKFNYNDWMIDKEEAVELKIIDLFRIYLKFIIQNLNETERSIYIQTICKIKNNEKTRRELEEKYNSELKTKSDQLNYYSVEAINSIKEEGDFVKYFIKILKTLGVKYEQTKSFLKTNETTNNEIEKNFQDANFRFYILYKIFENHEHIFILS